MLNMDVLVRQFLGAKKAKRLSARTIKAYKDRCALFVGWLQDRPLTRDNLREYLTYLQDQPQLSETTVASYFRDVAVFCSWLADEGVIDINLAAGLAPKVPTLMPASYTKEQIKKLLNVSDPRDRALIVVMLDTGLRASELLSLNRSAINYRTGRFVVRGKGNRDRAGWLSSYALKMVRAYLETRDDADPVLWLSETGARLTKDGLYQTIVRRAELAGIRQEVRRLVHGFRATFAANYIRRGGDLETLRKLLGHKSLAMAAHYAQLADEELGEHKNDINPLAEYIDDAA